MMALMVVIALHNMVTYGHRWSQYGHMWSHLVKLFVVEVTELHSDGLNCIMVKIPLHNMVTGWSQVVTFVTGQVKDLRHDGLDGYYGPMASNQELVIREEEESEKKKKCITY